MVFNYLKSQGLMPEFDAKNNILFKYQMKTFLYFNNDEDEAFFNLTMPCIFDVTDENRMEVFEALNEVNETTKVVKLSISSDNSVWCATEIMMDSTPELDDLIPRLINILLNSNEKFYNIIG